MKTVAQSGSPDTLIRKCPNLRLQVRVRRCRSVQALAWPVLVPVGSGFVLGIGHWRLLSAGFDVYDQRLGNQRRELDN